MKTRIILLKLWIVIAMLSGTIMSNKLIAQCQIKPSTNMVVNSEFNTGISNWTLMTGMNGCTVPPTSSISYDSNALKISVNNNYLPPCPAPFNWRTFVLGNMTGSLIQGHPYVFTFKVRTNSSSPVNFDAAVRLTTSQWQIQFQNQEIKAINQWQSFCKIQLHTIATASNIEVAFFFGQVADGTEIWIDDVYVGTPAGFIESHKIRTNQVGYLTNYPKEGLSVDSCNSFVIRNALNNSVVYSGNCQKLGKYPLNHPAVCNYELDTIWKLNFSSFNSPGTYYLEADNGYTSYHFKIQNDIYDSLRKDALRFFYFQRCGHPLSVSHWGNLSRPTCHPQDANATIVNSSFFSVGNKNVSGGWHDAGDYVKYTFNNALATVFLAKAYLENPLAFSDNEQIPESGNGVPDIVDELAFNTNFLLQLQDTVSVSPDFGGVHSKISTQQWNVHLVPQNENQTRYVTPPTTISTAGFVSAMCYLYRIFNSIPAYQHIAAPCSTAAFRGWTYLNTHNQTTLDPTNNGTHISTATYDWYPDEDERIWAAAELYRTFHHSAAHNYFLSNYTYCNNILLDNNFYAHDVTGSACSSMQFHHQFAWLGFLSYMESLQPDPGALVVLNNWLLSHADTIVNRTNNDYFSFNLRTWGNNYNLLNNAMLLKKAYDVTRNLNYIHALNKNLDYILGKNITNYSFITGYGSQTPVNLNHLHTKNDEFTAIPNGAIVGGPAANPVTPPPLPAQYSNDFRTLYFDTCTMHAKRYLDFPGPFFSNEPAIDYNARLVYALYSLLPYSITSVADPSISSSSILVYPNPNNGKFIIVWEQNTMTTTYDIDIYNIFGQAILQKHNLQLNSPTEIDLSLCPSGIYFIVTKIGKQSYRQKIIIQR